MGYVDRLTGIVGRYGMAINVEKSKNENLRTIVPCTNYDRSKATGEYGMLQLFGLHDNK
jgi:hypothetical protein